MSPCPQTSLSLSVLPSTSTNSSWPNTCPRPSPLTWKYNLSRGVTSTRARQGGEGEHAQSDRTAGTWKHSSNGMYCTFPYSSNIYTTVSLKYTEWFSCYFITFYILKLQYFDSISFIEQWFYRVTTNNTRHHIVRLYFFSHFCSVLTCYVTTLWDKLFLYQNNVTRAHAAVWHASVSARAVVERMWSSGTLCSNQAPPYVLFFFFLFFFFFLTNSPQ